MAESNDPDPSIKRHHGISRRDLLRAASLLATHRAVSPKITQLGRRLTGIPEQSKSPETSGSNQLVAQYEQAIEGLLQGGETAIASVQTFSHNLLNTRGTHDEALVSLYDSSGQSNFKAVHQKLVPSEHLEEQDEKHAIVRAQVPVPRRGYSHRSIDQFFVNQPPESSQSHVILRTITQKPIPVDDYLTRFCNTYLEGKGQQLFSSGSLEGDLKMESQEPQSVINETPQVRRWVAVETMETQMHTTKTVGEKTDMVAIYRTVGFYPINDPQDMTGDSRDRYPTMAIQYSAYSTTDGSESPTSVVQDSNVFIPSMAQYDEKTTEQMQGLLLTAFEQSPSLHADSSFVDAVRQHGEVLQVDIPELKMREDLIIPELPSSRPDSMSSRNA